MWRSSCCDLELRGASHVEAYDSGELNLRAGQAMSKFKGLAGKASLSKFEQEKAAAAAEVDSESEDHPGHPPSKNGSKDDLGSNKDSDVDESSDNLSWVTSSLLDAAMQAGLANKVLQRGPAT